MTLARSSDELLPCPFCGSDELDGPSTCRHEGHDWKITCADCGETREIPYFHLGKGTMDPDAKLYSARDVEAITAIALAGARYGIENSGRRETGATVEGEAPGNRTPSGPTCPRCNDERVIREHQGKSWWDRNCPDCTEQTEHYP